MDPNHGPSDTLSDQYYSMATKIRDDLANCFAHLQAGIPFELDFRSIAAAQDKMVPYIPRQAEVLFQ